MSILFPGIADSIHVRLSAAANLQLGPWWTETDLNRSMWRLCRADGEGAFLDYDSEYDSESYAIPAGRFYLVPPGLDFRARLERPVKLFHVLFEVLGWPAAAVRDLLPAPVTLGPDTMRDGLADELCGEVNSNKALGPALSCRVKSLVHLALANLEQALPAEKVSLLRHIADGQLDLLEVLRHIDCHIEEPLDNALLAEISHSSESCFIRRFREAMGQTPARYVQDRRIARASELLVSTDQSIDEVARRCGFANRYYFSRVFAERMGRPPVRYRNERPSAKVCAG
jgi:AraC-like DNA-binding protein